MGTIITTSNITTLTIIRPFPHPFNQHQVAMGQMSTGRQVQTHDSRMRWQQSCVDLKLRCGNKLMAGMLPRVITFKTAGGKTPGNSTNRYQQKKMGLGKYIFSFKHGFISSIYSLNLRGVLYRIFFCGTEQVWHLVF